MHTSRLFLALSALAISGWAQPSAGVAGPVTGFIFDAQAGAVRPMLGIPGAAYLGNGVGTAMDAASVAPDGSAALAAQRGGKLVLYTGLRNARPASVVVTGAIAPNRFAWTADAGAAAVYSPRPGRGQTITGLGQSPVAGAPIDLSSLPGQVTALAFDGERLILAVASADAGGIYLASASAGIQRIASAVSPSAIALAGSSLFFTDSQSQQIFQVQNYARTPGVVLFANDSGIDLPVGLQASADGQRLFVANAGNRKLAVYDVPSRAPVESLDLAFTPTRLDLFGDPSVFLMNSSGPGPLYVVRDSGPGKAAAVYFVPAPPHRRPLRAPIRPS